MPLLPFTARNCSSAEKAKDGQCGSVQGKRRSRWLLATSHTATASFTEAPVAPFQVSA